VNEDSKTFELGAGGIFVKAADRFSKRVSAYLRGRPDYPQTLVDHLISAAKKEGPLQVADLGAGTGFLSRHIAQRGHHTFVVEPNAEMLDAAKKHLAALEGASFINRGAEDTGLAEKSIDLITVAQAFHWFDEQKAALEFRRILKADGKVALIWNRRATSGSDFAEAYEHFIGRFGSGYAEVSSKWESKAQMRAIFGDSIPEPMVFENAHPLDRDGLLARAESSSYLPRQDSPRFGACQRELEALFEKHQRAGRVTLPYRTHLYLGPVVAA
jgi:ubiquinone/menaquinone biosynthesis C-methylase UbiE